MPAPSVQPGKKRKSVESNEIDLNYQGNKVKKLQIYYRKSHLKTYKN